MFLESSSRRSLDITVASSYLADNGRAPWQYRQFPSVDFEPTAFWTRFRASVGLLACGNRTRRAPRDEAGTGVEGRDQAAHVQVEGSLGEDVRTADSVRADEDSCLQDGSSSDSDSSSRLICGGEDADKASTDVDEPCGNARAARAPPTTVLVHPDPVLDLADKVGQVDFDAPVLREHQQAGLTEDSSNISPPPVHLVHVAVQTDHPSTRPPTSASNGHLPSLQTPRSSRSSSPISAATALPPLFDQSPSTPLHQLHFELPFANRHTGGSGDSTPASSCPASPVVNSLPTTPLQQFDFQLPFADRHTGTSGYSTPASSGPASPVVNSFALDVEDADLRWLQTFTYTDVSSDARQPQQLSAVRYSNTPASNDTGDAISNLVDTFGEVDLDEPVPSAHQQAGITEHTSISPPPVPLVRPATHPFTSTFKDLLSLHTPCSSRSSSPISALEALPSLFDQSPSTPWQQFDLQLPFADRHTGTSGDSTPTSSCPASPVVNSLPTTPWQRFDFQLLPFANRHTGTSGESTPASSCPTSPVVSSFAPDVEDAGLRWLQTFTYTDVSSDVRPVQQLSAVRYSKTPASNDTGDAISLHHPASLGIGRPPITDSLQSSGRTTPERPTPISPTPYGSSTLTNPSQPAAYEPAHRHYSRPHSLGAPGRDSSPGGLSSPERKPRFDISSSDQHSLNSGTCLPSPSLTEPILRTNFVHSAAPTFPAKFCRLASPSPDPRCGGTAHFASTPASSDGSSRYVSPPTSPPGSVKSVPNQDMPGPVYTGPARHTERRSHSPPHPGPIRRGTPTPAPRVVVGQYGTGVVSSSQAQPSTRPPKHGHPTTRRGDIHSNQPPARREPRVNSSSDALTPVTPLRKADPSRVRLSSASLKENREASLPPRGLSLMGTAPLASAKQNATSRFGTSKEEENIPFEHRAGSSKYPDARPLGNNGYSTPKKTPFRERKRFSNGWDSDEENHFVRKISTLFAPTAVPTEFCANVLYSPSIGSPNTSRLSRTARGSSMASIVSHGYCTPNASPARNHQVKQQISLSISARGPRTSPHSQPRRTTTPQRKTINRGAKPCDPFTLMGNEFEEFHGAARFIQGAEDHKRALEIRANAEAARSTPGDVPLNRAITSEFFGTNAANPGTTDYPLRHSTSGTSRGTAVAPRQRQEPQRQRDVQGSSWSRDDGRAASQMPSVVNVEVRSPQGRVPESRLTIAEHLGYAANLGYDYRLPPSASDRRVTTVVARQREEPQRQGYANEGSASNRAESRNGRVGASELPLSVKVKSDSSQPLRSGRRRNVTVGRHNAPA
ncbi:hypothetical protein FA15DRAFT_701096 [Coprinopsis marcescibilis]|uniref:Uncharacterized protein n=1 Tax=Coprinopsis marcescibilis TaxID=230819 RepID=A0A5C3L7B1_COPMA|nr:hypothetical protein FA15DRAFT_701096 [Coprinopsis marcescibilis]